MNAKTNVEIHTESGSEINSESDSEPRAEAKAEPGGLRDYTPQQLGRSTRRLDIALSQLLSAHARRLGVSVPELLVLEHAGLEDDQIGPGELARRLQMSSGAVTALLDRLTASGHVVRAPHLTDRRKVLVRRTAMSNDAVLAEVAPLQKDIRALTESMTAEERRVVGRFLNGFIDIVARHTAGTCRPRSRRATGAAAVRHIDATQPPRRMPQ